MYRDNVFGALLDAAADCGDVVKLGSDASHVTPVTAVTDVPYGVILGGDAGELDDVDLVAGDFVDVGFDGILPCTAGKGGVTAGGWVVATEGGVVIDVPESLDAETTVIALGIATAAADEGDPVDVAIMRCAFTVPESGS
jgi:hypothetical protein